jgi:hypothetical protein
MTLQQPHPKYCSNCLHFLPNASGKDITLSKCAVLFRATSFVAPTTPENQYCEVARASTGACKPEGLLYVEKLSNLEQVA